jgi:hypothetical protein
MKLRSVFLVFTLFIFTIGLSWSIFYLVNAGQDSFNNQMENYLVSVIDSNEERIGDVFYEIEGDALFLAESEKVRDILKKEVAESKEATRADVEGKVYVVVREVENYIKLHPEMTLDELVKNNEFRSIATQKIGETGYAIIIGAEDRIMYVHIDPKMEGVAMIGSERSTVEIDTILQEAIENGVADGFYDWVDIDGETRRKYTEVRKIRTETADGKTLLSVTTAYVDDYLVAQDVSESLNNYFSEFAAIRDYHNVLLVSKENRVIYMAGSEVGLGNNLENVANGFGEILPTINKLEGDEVGFCGPFIGHVNDPYLQFAATSRVYDGNEFLGTIIVIEEMISVNDVLTEAEDVQSGKFDENYLVNGQGLLITPLRARKVDIMVQEIKTEHVEECLEDFAEAERRDIAVEEYEVLENKKGELLFVSFLNFNGDLTLGLHRPIGKVNWCVLSEVNAEDVLEEPMEKSFNSQIKFRLIVFGILVLLIIVSSFFIDKRYVLKKRKWSGVISRTRLSKLKMGSIFFISVILSGIYLVGVRLFFVGFDFNKLGYLNLLINGIFFTLSLVLLFYGFKIKNDRGRWLTLTGVFFTFFNVVRVCLSDYQSYVGLIGVELWGIVSVMNIFGYVCLLNYFRGAKL